LFSVCYASIAFYGNAIAPTISAYIGETEQITCKIEKLARSPNFAFSNDLNPTPEEIKLALADISIKYGLDYEQIKNIAVCESGLNNTQIGDSGKARGIFQFWKSTFDKHCQGNYLSASDQIKCFAQMFVSKHEKEWTCFKKLYQKVQRVQYDNCLFEI